MKIVKKLIISLLFTLFFFSFFSNNAISATTIGNTTFPADVGKTYTWKATHPPEAKAANYKLIFKVESIYQGVHNTIDVLMVNVTVKQYNSVFGWSTILDNELYLAANNTQSYINFFGYAVAPLVIPTPINLPLVAEEMFLNNYSIVDNTIIDTYNGDSDEYTYNDEGFLTIYALMEEGEFTFRAVLDTGGDGGAIPFGIYFLIFLVIGVIGLLYFKKQKIIS